MPLITFGHGTASTERIAELRDDDGQWRLAMDPGAFAVGAPDRAQWIARSQAPVPLPAANSTR